MRLPGKDKIPTDQLRKMALAALLTALDGDEGEKKEKSGGGGVRKLAVGAAISAAGFAAFKNRDFIRDQLLAGQQDEDEDLEDEDEELEDEELEDEDAEDDVEDAEPEDEDAAPQRKRPSRARS
jgi:hypothetical protein